MVQNGGSHVVVTADSSGLYTQLNDASLREIYHRADLVTPDSIGVVWALKRANADVQGRVSGVDIMAELCKLSAEQGFRVALLGAAPGIAELAASKLKQSYPGLNVVYTRHGYFAPEEDSTVAKEIGELKPDILFVALGIPRQEQFIFSQLENHMAKVSLGVGGSFDVFSGKAKRAPAVVQRMHLEWLWRTISNPKKIAKASTLPKFVLAVLQGKGK